jgi:catechol 2,3-dioxygenase-like lactoylglutathione lyase family enzyme
MLKRNVFMDVLVKRFVRANRIPAVHSPLIPPLQKMGWRESGEALSAFEREERGCVRSSRSILDYFKVSAFATPCGWASPQPRSAESRNVVGFWEMAPAKAALFLLLAALTLSAQAGVREVGAIGLTVGDLDRELMFYTNTLPFELVSISEVSGREQDALLGLSDVKLRIAMLKLGDERITLTEHVASKGQPIPQDSRSYDHWFQHIAIVVRDMDKAYERLRQHKVKHVSTGPQTLPAWNKGAAGIKAFYFRDPEDHVLEIIFFPPGKGDPKWQTAAGEGADASRIFLGIDHTAIVVSDTDQSLAFYRDLLGLRVAGESENYGVEQEHLNQVFGARLHITGLRAERGPGIEFLEYITPPGGRPLPTGANASDLFFWNTHLTVNDPAKVSARLRESGVAFVSRPGGTRSQIVRDPDGHAMQLDAADNAVAPN